MTEIIKIDAKSFEDMCNHIKELEQRNEFLERQVEGVKINNSKLTMEKNQLLDKVHFLDQKCKAYHKEVLEITSMSMFEFSTNYCTAEQQEADGRAFAKALLGGK